MVRRQDQPGSAYDSTRYCHKLQLSAGDLIRIEVFLGYDLESVQRIADEAYALIPRNILIRQRQFQVFKDSPVADQVIALEDETDMRLVEFIPLTNVQL